MVAGRENVAPVRAGGGWACCRVVGDVAAGAGVGREDERGLPVTPVHFGMRARLRAWRRGFDLRVASCCLEHAGQYFGFCLTEAPGQPAGNPFPG
jgi:hypothetical protein